MCSNPLKQPTFQMPEIPALPDTTAEKDVSQQAESGAAGKEAKRAKLFAGQKSTILTNPLGDNNEQLNVRKKTLLGG